MAIILAIDPGPEISTWVAYDPQQARPLVAIGRDWSNAAIRDKLLGIDRWPESGETRQVVCEDIEGRGMAVGVEVFATVRWIGRFEELCAMKNLPFYRMARRRVKIHLCGTDRATPANTRTVMLDRFGPGKEKAVGLKKTPGSLYGVAGHAWSALEVAVTWCDLNP